MQLNFSMSWSILSTCLAIYFQVPATAKPTNYLLEIVHKFGEEGSPPKLEAEVEHFIQPELTKNDQFKPVSNAGKMVAQKKKDQDYTLPLKQLAGLAVEWLPIFTSVAENIAKG